MRDRRWRGFLALAIVCLCFHVTVARATTIRLPTDGYVRPGRYFPVEVNGPTHLTADGCVPTDVATGGRSTVPMLAVTAPGDLHAGDGPPLVLRLPADDERLIGVTFPVPIADLFPGTRPIPIQLDPATPLPGPPAAWELLDAVVLDPAAMAALTPGKRSALLAGGVTLAVTGDAPPDPPWPWRHQGSLWVLSHPPAGPTGDAIVPDAYAPTDAWTPGWPAAVRRQAAVAAVLVATFTVALLVALRRRWAIVATIAFPLLAAIAIAAWRATLDPAAHAGGAVIVVGPAPWSQRDAWAFAKARSACDVTIPWAGWTHPIFASAESAVTNRVRLTVAADGSLAFARHLPANHVMAFVRREVAVGRSPPTLAGGFGAPLRQLAPLYLSTGDRVLGETSPGPGGWAGIVLSRSR